MPAVELNHICLVLLGVILLYFAWMDVALYYKLQSKTSYLLLTQNYVKAKNDLLKLKTTNQSIVVVEKLTTQKTPSSSPIDLTSFDAFNPISIKSLMLDHTNHYIYYPLGSWIDKDLLKISESWTYVTPDVISWSHVIVASVAAKFLTLEHHCHKRLGVLLFELRSFLDSLDGLVARSRANQRAIVADSSQWGYWVDGLCDLFGTIFFMIAVLLICQKALPRKLITFNVRSLFYHWIPDKIKKNTLAMTEADQKPFLPTHELNNNNITKTPISFRQSTVIVVCMASIMVLSSTFWNRYMEQYHMLLEIPIKAETASGNAEKFQLDTLRSATFWIIAWSWRLINPHAIMSILLITIFFDKLMETLHWVHCLGFLPLFVLIIMSEIHLQATAWKLWYLAH